MLRVRCIRNHEQVFEGTAVQVILPGDEGEVSVMDFHAPMLCALGVGDVQIDERRIAVRRGIVRVARNAVTIVAH